MKSKQKQLESVLALIKTWIETESGPTQCDFSQPDLQLSIKIRGYKRLILERKFEDSK
jgi:hypothetical protein